ncbi:MAG: hypothetical protein R3183_04840 [Oleiphilaceae bacterium]|nr:hypothetical protein [Oleiphilaceae bacterium]
MKRTLVYLGLGALLAMLLSQAAVQYLVYQGINDLRKELKDELDVDFSWVSADFNGVLTLHQFEVTPFSLKRTFEAEELKLYFDDYLALVTELPNLSLHNWQALKRIQTLNGQTELRGVGVDEWLAETTHPVTEEFFALHACSRSKADDAESFYRALGIPRLAMDVDLAFNVERLSRQVSLSLGVDMVERGRLDIYATLSEGALASALVQADWRALELQSLQVAYVENGYFRRISNYCTQDTAWTREAFALAAAQQWQMKLLEQGVRASDQFAALYANFLGLGGKLRIAIQSDRAIQLRNWEWFLDKELVSLLGIQFRLNEADIQGVSLSLIRDGLYPPPPEKPQEVVPVSALPHEKGFRQIDPESAQFLPQQRLKVKTRDGRLIEGMVQRISKEHVVLQQQVKGGQVSYSIKLADIVELWRWQ